MTRHSLFAGLTMILLAGGAAQAQSPHREPVFDDYAYHSQRLAPGTAEYDYVVGRRDQAQMQKQQVDERRLDEALQACGKIQPLAQATRDKCEIRARQIAADPAASRLPGARPPGL